MERKAETGEGEETGQEKGGESERERGEGKGKGEMEGKGGFLLPPRSTDPAYGPGNGLAYSCSRPCGCCSERHE